MFGSKSISRVAAAAAVFWVGIGSAQAAVVSGQGTWETTLQARYFTSDQSKSPDAYYDTDLNVTWLADAEYQKTLGVLLSPGAGPTMDWYNATAWVESLNIKGVVGWRLPAITPLSIYEKQAGCDFAYAGSDCGYSPNTQRSEMAHLFYVTLGNKALISPSGVRQSTGGLTNTGPFQNLGYPDQYWLGAGYAQSQGSAWAFDLSGSQGTVAKINGLASWAVHTGDVGYSAAVPEPQTYALMLAGLSVLGAAARRRSPLDPQPRYERR